MSRDLEVDQPSAATPTREEHRLFAVCVEALYQHSIGNRLANVVNATIVAALLWGTASSHIIVAWLVAVFLMLLWRHLSARRFHRFPARASMSTWAASFTVGSAVSGLIWGLGGLALFPVDHLPLQVLLAFVLGGMAAGASSSLASHLPSFYAYIVPALLPITIRLAVVADNFHIGMSLMVALFGVTVASIARRNNRTLVESYRVSFANDALVERLVEASATLEERVADRTRRLEAESHARADAEQQLMHVQRLDALGRLTGGVAHDFNNLLTVVIQSLELLESETSHAANRKFVRPALQAALRGSELTRSLLAFSRRQPLRPELVDVCATVRRLAATILPRVIPESIDIEFEGAAEVRLANVDPTQLEAALLNLAANARDAMPGGGVLRIQVRDCDPADANLAAGEYIEIQIVDDGHGMDEATAKRAFEPFFSTKGERGTGLGLSMVYGFARQSGGVALTESVPGQGTMIRVVLPRARGEQAAASVPEPTADPGSGELLLVVEDETDVRALTVQSLRSLGYSTVEADNARTAVGLLESNDKIQMVLTDVVMPGDINGLELAAAARGLRPDVPILLVSGYSEASAEIEHWPVLSKPYRRSDLAKAVRRALKPDGPQS